MADKLAVHVLLETSFINRYIKRLFPAERKFAQCHSQPAATIIPQGCRASPANTIDEFSKKEETRPSRIKVAKQIMVPPHTLYTKLMTRPSSGPSMTDPVPLCASRTRLLVYKELVKVASQQLFYILVMNWSSTTINLPKRNNASRKILDKIFVTVVDLFSQTKFPFEILKGKSAQNNHVEEIKDDIPYDKYYATAEIHSKPKIDKTTQMLRRKTSKETDSGKLKQSWQDKVHLSNEYAEYRKKFLNTLSKLQSMWNGYLNRLNVAKYCIELGHEDT